MAVRKVTTAEGDSPGDYTIDQLAQASGATVRNIRAHQSRGLLPPPAVRGRTGFYTDDHLDRLRLVSEMQADGFNLNAIKRILDNLRAGSAGRVLGFEQAVRAPWADEQPEVVTGAVLGELGGPTPNAALLKKAIRLRLLVPLGEDRYEVPSPTLLRAGPELDRLGVPLEARLAILERIQKHTEGVSSAFIDLFVEHIWKPFHQSGRPDEDWPRVHEALDRLRPLATEALLAAFGQSMSRGVTAAFGKALEQEVRAPRKPTVNDDRRKPAGDRRNHP